MPELILMCGPIGSGKSTLAKTFASHVYINRDEQGKEQHFKNFDEAVAQGKDIVVDKQNFLKGQRQDFINKAKGYCTRIIVLHENFETCLERCKNRKDHPSIKDEKTASKVLNMFFSKYERVEDNEADVVERRWPPGDKPLAVICDLDGTLCNIEHRLHFVKGPEKKNWKGFFENLKDDTVNNWCARILAAFAGEKIVLCSGRADNYKNLTKEWLDKNSIVYDKLFMRNRSDFRQDYIAKELILDFEILTRYTPYFFLDDRKQVVDMWRRRGYTCLQCADGEF